MAFTGRAASAVVCSLLLLSVAAPAFAGPPTLEQICGPQSKVRPGQVLWEKCQAAYAAGNASLIENNNTYVHGAAAVVCAHSCMAGGFNSCGSGGGACSGAASLGRKAMADDRGSTDSFSAAQLNGSDALSMVMGKSPADMAATAGGTPSAAAAPLPAACAAAAKSRTVQDR